MRKASDAGADTVIFDLEDSVAHSAKTEARALLEEALSLPRPVPVVVRVNAVETTWHLGDLIAAVRGGADAVMLPKCNGKEELQRLSDRLDALETAFGAEIGRTAILPLVTETAFALHRLDYRGASPRLAALCFAAEDLASDLGVPARSNSRMNELLADARRQVAIAAAAAEVRAIDTPFPDHRAADALERETREAACLGFAGKLCIHPGQVATVHAALRPAPERVEWGRAVIAALERTASGVAVVDGQMVDLAHLRLARRYVQMADAAETRE